MISWFKRAFDSAPTRPAQPDDLKRLYHEMERLRKENDELRLRQQMQQKKKSQPATSHKYHLEFFLYDATNQEDANYTSDDIHRYPMMGFTIHFLDEEGIESRPEWLTYLLRGLEQTFAVMKVASHRVEERNLYSQFVDIKLYPHIEVKKCIYLVFQQLYQWQEHGRDEVSLRVHIGGDDLYQDLLNTHLEAV
ncbi:hypothetical protein [Desmospora profundinema]|uniref:Uncharacterized protein n=1 Tax=Desmospora profundinema TaxID=1571184 RepID=A0ABU1IR73_9BACL|nr:hypothetical protein [Desmospora profundinema]MDR6227297.1 hypothetical protein [Desmospora profundinema]